MKNLSIKYQLTIWYALLIFTVVATFFGVFYYYTKSYLIFETDRTLHAHSSQLAFDISTNLGEVHKDDILIMVEASKGEVPGMFIDVYDTLGQGAGSSSEYSVIALEAIRTSAPVYVSDNNNEFSMRVIAYPFKSDLETIGAVVMGHPTDVYENTLFKLKTVGLLMAIFLILPSLFLGYFIAGIVSSPITQLANEIEQITTENINKEIKINAFSYESSILIRNFNNMIDRLGKAFELEKQFLGEVAHEIKTPLSVIKSSSEIALSRQRTPVEYEETLKQTLTQVDKLSKNLHGLIDFAWSQTADISKQFKLVNLSELLSELIEGLKPLAEGKYQKMEVELGSNIKVMGNSEKLYQVFQNIIENAIKYTPEHGTIGIVLSNVRGKAIVRVQDSGCGMTGDEIAKIFNRFYRTQDNKNIAGFGLGLAISDSIIKAHKGKIVVTSKKEQGSIFEVTLKSI